MSFACIPVQIESNKNPLRKRLLALLLLELATFPPQADHVLVDLFSSMAAGGGGQGPVGGAPPQLTPASLPEQGHQDLWNKEQHF